MKFMFLSCVAIWLESIRVWLIERADESLARQAARERERTLRNFNTLADLGECLERSRNDEKA